MIPAFKTDAAGRIDLYFRVNTNNVPISLSFLNSAGDAYSFIYDDFQLIVKRYEGDRKNAILLGIGSGLSLSGNVLTFQFLANNCNVEPGEYYWMLYKNDYGRPWLEGKAYAIDGIMPTITETSTVTINEGGYDITVTISEASSGGSWGSITGTLSNQTDLNNALNAKQDVSNLSNDGTFTTTSTSTYPSTQATKDYIASQFTAKIEDAITDGETTKAPTGNAVYDALLLKEDKNFSYASYTDDITLQLSDAYKVLEVNKATAVSVTIPPNSSVAFAIGTKIAVKQTGAGLLTFVAGSGVTVTASAGVLTAPAQNAFMLLHKRSTNTWYLENGVPSSGGTDVLQFKGSIDCSTNPNYPAGDAGDVYKISVAGKIGGASGINVEVNDLITCTVDGSTSGTQAAVGANWLITQTNIDGAVTGPASATSGNIATFNGTSGKVVQDSAVSISTDTTLFANSDSLLSTQKAVKTYVDNKLTDIANCELAVSVVTETNAANSETALGGSSRFYTKFDATSYSTIRLFAVVSGTSASANNPRIYLSYSTDGGSSWTTIGDGTTAPSNVISLSATGIRNTDWLTIPAGAKGDYLFRCSVNGGDGVADPVIARASVQFKK